MNSLLNLKTVGAIFLIFGLTLYANTVTAQLDLLKRFSNQDASSALRAMQRFEPIVTQISDQSGLANSYNNIAGKFLQGKDEANVNAYALRKVVNTLFTVIANEEKAIRANPVEYGSQLLTDVFGVLQKH